jgi:ribonuclease M5
VVPPEQIKHCYIPQVKGKEKRKAHAGKEGLLGVEGMTDEMILRAIRQSGATILGETAAPKQPITKADLCALGLAGGQNAAQHTDATAESQEFVCQFHLNPSKYFGIHQHSTLSII